MTFPTSLRWRLPLSYGAIALIATFSLGAILLFVLDRYYALQERHYLLSNAQAIGSVFESFDASDLKSALIQSQVDSLSALIQTQIQIFDEEEKLVADSGLPAQNGVLTTLSLRVESGDVAQEFSQTTQSGGNNQQITSSLAVQGGGTRVESITTIEQAGLSEVITPLSILETPYSFGLGFQDPEIRSDQIVRHEVVSGQGKRLGAVQLSQGPAFGRAILISVAWGVGVAGLLAVAVATLVGWLASRRITAPISQLVWVSNQMASGDLKARAAVQRQDEIGELAEAFNEMSDQLESKMGTLRHFVADAAHELRTPLTALKTNLELAEKNEDNGRYLTSAHVQLNRIQQLTNDLLQLSRLENEAGLWEMRPLNLTTLLKAQEERYATLAEQAELDFEMRLPEQAIMVQGYEAALLRAVDNLVENSLKFTLAEGWVAIQIRRCEQTAVVTVKDNGIGLDDDSGRLFSRFYRGRNASDFPGSGLGLAITKAIVDAHQGQIQANKGAKGTEMKVTLPLFVDGTPQ